MKYYFKYAIALFLLIGLNLKSQTSLESRMFFNRTHVAIAKVEKEIYNSKDSSYTNDIKKAIKYQVIALNLFGQNNFRDAVGYSYKARVQCIEICNKMNISEGAFYALNSDETNYCKPSDYINLTSGKLTPKQAKQIDELDIFNLTKFFEIDLSIK